MQRFAAPVPVPAAGRASPRTTPQEPRRAGPPRGAIWHAIQLKAARSATPEPATEAESAIGLPKRLKAGIERLSGLAMDDVRVHRDSPEPARIGALAFAQGRDIHLAPGQGRYLPHEAWHVVQQKQGRVSATTQAKGLAMNADATLEAEADRMGAGAMRLGSQSRDNPAELANKIPMSDVVQRATPPGQPDTGDYTPQGDKEPYVSAPRMGVSDWAGGWRGKIIAYWATQGVARKTDSSLGGHYVVRSAGSGLWCPEAGFQLDHVRPVDQMDTDIQSRAREIGQELSQRKWPAAWEQKCYGIFDKEGNHKPWKGFETERTAEKLVADLTGKSPTLAVRATQFGARSYYHDRPNLQPLLSSENASKNDSMFWAPSVPKTTPEEMKIEAGAAAAASELNAALARREQWDKPEVVENKAGAVVESLKPVMALAAEGKKQIAIKQQQLQLQMQQQMQAQFQMQLQQAKPNPPMSAFPPMGPTTISFSQTYFSPPSSKQDVKSNK